MSNPIEKIGEAISEYWWLFVSGIAVTIYGYRQRILEWFGDRINKHAITEDKLKTFALERQNDILEEVREGRKQLANLHQENQLKDEKIIEILENRIATLEKGQDECSKREERYLKELEKTRKENENLRSEHYQMIGREKEQREILMKQAEVFAHTVMETRDRYKPPFSKNVETSPEKE